MQMRFVRTLLANNHWCGSSRKFSATKYNNILDQNIYQSILRPKVNACLIRRNMSDTTYNYNNDALEARKPEYPVHPFLLSRTSPREMSGEEITDEELLTLFEAARWAPSHYNLQPWRFVYAKRNTDNWQKFVELLWPLNQKWAQNASVLIVVVSNKYFVYQGTKTLIPSHSFDAGAAWMSLALEGTARGFVVHAMGGIDYDKAPDVLNIPRDTHNVECIVAIGRRPPKEERKANETVTQRNPIDSFISVGEFVNRENY